MSEQVVAALGTQVKCGLFLSGWVDPAETHPARYIARLLGRIPIAEQAGLSSIWVGQHLLGHPWPVLDTSAWLARIIGETERMQVGGVYLLPLAHPVRLAESLVTLDNLSGGRFTLCAALGWRPAEFEAIGVPIGERVSRMGEVLQVMRLLWQSSEPVSFEGRHYQFRNVRMAARPERAGGIPVWMGASSVPAVRRAARTADAWLGSSHTPLSTLRDLARSYAEELGPRAPVVTRRPLLRHFMLARTDAEARSRFVQAFTAYYRALGNWGIFKEVVGEEHASGEGELPPGRAIVGSPETVVAQMREYMQLGFNEFIFQVGLPGTHEPHVRESLELLGGEVLPQFAGAAGAAAGPGAR